MPIPLGILAAAGRSQAPAGAFDLLESTVVGSGGQASAEFTNLGTKYGSTYQHFQLRMLVRSTRSDANNDQLGLQFNADTGNNYRRHELVADGSSVNSTAGNAEDAIRIREIETAQSTANVFNAIVLDILDPFETKNKTVRFLNGTASRSRIMLGSGLWVNTNSVTSIKLVPLATLAQYTRISLYGIKATA
jgi:hypothetical protein